MENKNCVEDEPEVKRALMNGSTRENGPDGPGEHLDAKGQGASQKFKKIIKITVALIIFLFFPASLIGNIIQAVLRTESQATLPSSDGCFHGWNRHGDFCYFFSDEQRDWDFSRSNCSSNGASLVIPVHEEEWAFIKTKKNEYWIYLQRDKADEPWKWSDGSNVTQFDVKGAGFCGYLDEDGVTSTNCNSDRHWICKKPLHAA